MRAFPPYPQRPHSGSGQARIKINGRHRYLGVHGSPESWAEYQRLLAEWRSGQLGTSPHNSPQLVNAPVRTVRELVGRYMAWAEVEYAEADGTVRHELSNIKYALRPLLALHGQTVLLDFGPKALKGLLAVTAAGTWEGASVPWSRGFANANLSRWKGVWKWAESEELVPPGTYHALQTVRALRPGKAVERPEVPPVPEDVLVLTLPELRPIVREAVDLLLLTGARPSELLRLTPGDLDRSGAVEVAQGYTVQLGSGVWAYQPAKHKTAYRGHRRVILFGAAAQAVLQPLLEGRPADAPIFSPREATAKLLAMRRAVRKTPVQPSQISRAKPAPRKTPGERYTVAALTGAIHRACDRAGVPRWGAYRLRHNAGTRLRAQFGPELARIILGHKHLAMTAVYTMDDLQAAAKAMGEAG